MKVRLLAGSLLAAPALLVATATNGHAGAVQGAVTFAGRITITPSPSGASGSICFDALTCGSVDGVATGVANAKPVTGMYGTLSTNDSCTAVAPYAPVATGDLSVSFKRDELGPVGPVGAQWLRAGLVAVIVSPNVGAPAAGAAVVAPAPHVGDLPLCGSPIDLVLVGAMAFA